MGGKRGRRKKKGIKSHRREKYVSKNPMTIEACSGGTE